MWCVAEVCLAALPGLANRLQLAQAVGTVCDVGRQGEWPLGQRLNEGACDPEPEIGESHSEVLLEEVAEPRLVLREGNERTELGRDRRHPQQLAEQAAAKGNHVGADSYGLAPYRFDVAGMLGSLVGEALLVDLVHLLHSLDDLDQVLGRGTIGVEGYDDASGDGVYLRPLHPFDGVQRPFHVAGQDLALRVVDSAYLNVSSSVTDPRPASSPTWAQTVQRATDDRARDRRALA